MTHCAVYPFMVMCYVQFLWGKKYVLIHLVAGNTHVLFIYFFKIVLFEDILQNIGTFSNNAGVYFCLSYCIYALYTINFPCTPRAFSFFFPSFFSVF